MLGVPDNADHEKKANVNIDLVQSIWCTRIFTVVAMLLDDSRLLLGFVHSTPLEIAGSIAAIIAVVGAF